MDDLFFKQSTLVPDNEVWVSPKTYDNPFSKYTKELGASTNSDYTAALRVVDDFLTDYGGGDFVSTFKGWCKDRLNRSTDSV
jgi:hypothetical protein